MCEHICHRTLKLSDPSSTWTKLGHVVDVDLHNCIDLPPNHATLILEKNQQYYSKETRRPRGISYTISIREKQNRGTRSVLVGTDRWGGAAWTGGGGANGCGRRRPPPPAASLHTPPRPPPPPSPPPPCTPSGKTESEGSASETDAERSVRPIGNQRSGSKGELDNCLLLLHSWGFLLGIGRQQKLSWTG